MDEKLRRQMQTLDRLYKESDRIGDDYAAHFGMNNTAFWVLYTLSRADKPVTQNDPCEEWFFPAQTINSAVSGLVKKELVRLEPIPGTRNRKSIVLTEAGRELCGRTISIVDEIERAAMLGFTEEERELYLSLFRRHLENLKKARAELLGETENK